MKNGLISSCKKELKKNNSHKEILKKDDSEVLFEIKKFLINNNVFSLGKYRNLGFINFNTIKIRFNLKYWNDLIILLDLEKEYKESIKKPKKEKIEPLFKKNIVTLTNNELIKIYKEFSEKIGAIRGASVSQMKKYNFPYSQSVYTKRFGPWKEFKTLCGYDFKLGTFYSKEEISENMLAARDKIGRRLSQNEINKDKSLPTVDTILKYFKTTKLSEVWNELEINKTAVIKLYSLDEIKKLLLKEHAKKKKPLTVKEIKENSNLPGISTIYRKFKTTKITHVWDEILK